MHDIKTKAGTSSIKAKHRHMTPSMQPAAARRPCCHESWSWRHHRSSRLMTHSSCTPSPRGSTKSGRETTYLLFLSFFLAPAIWLQLLQLHSWEVDWFSFILQIFLCGGRLIIGPDAASLLLSMFLILGPAIVFSYQMESTIHRSQQRMRRAAQLIVIITTAAVSESPNQL